MVETRITRCYRVMKPAKIEFSGSAIDCMIRDLNVRYPVANRVDRSWRGQPTALLVATVNLF